MEGKNGDMLASGQACVYILGVSCLPEEGRTRGIHTENAAGVSGAGGNSLSNNMQDCTTLLLATTVLLSLSGNYMFSMLAGLFPNQAVFPSGSASVQ